MGSSVSKLVFQPPPFVSYRSAFDKLILDSKISVEHVQLFTPLGDVIHGCYIDRDADITILYSHGNAEDMNCTVPFVTFDLSARIKCNVFCYDYEGYGGSEGYVSEEAVYRDIDVCYQYLTSTRKILSSNILLYGVSLGTAPTIYLAAKLKENLRGVFLQSPMLSVYRIGFETKQTLPGDMLCNIDRISDIKCKVLIMHGMQDEIVPFWHGQELLFNCSNPVSPLWVRFGSHNDLIQVLQDAFFKRLSTFIFRETAENKRTSLKSLIPVTIDNEPFKIIENEPENSVTSDVE